MDPSQHYGFLEQVSARPQPFETYTTETLWTDEHISARMLEFHLSPDSDAASRRPEFIAQSLDWLDRRFDLGEGKSVADFGCGPGLYTTGLAERGARVTGIDFSARSIAYAREQARVKGLDIDYLHQNYLEYRPEAQFDLITLIYCDLCPLGPDRRAQLLRIFHESLKDDGAVLFDVPSLAAFARREENAEYGENLMAGFWAAGPYFGFRHSFKYEEQKVALDKYVIVEPSRIWQVYNWAQYFDPHSLAHEVESAGLRIIETCADVAGNPYSDDADQFAVIAVKA